MGKLTGKAAVKGGVSAVGSTRQMWQSQVNTGQGQGASKLDSAHQNLVCGMQYYGAQYAASPVEFTTSGLDGKIVFWTRDELAGAMQGMAIS